jgi:hypothetical protein
MSIDIASRRETQRKILQMDILGVLAVIRKDSCAREIDEYAAKALMGGVLDNKAKKEARALFGLE